MPACLPAPVCLRLPARLSVRPYAFISATTTRQISETFNIGDFLNNKSVDKFQICLKSEESVGRFIVASNTICILYQTIK
jgi:hypothetical protein